MYFMKKTIVLASLIMSFISTSHAQEFFGEWKLERAEDIMDDTKQVYVTSAFTSPHKKMSFPYNDVFSWLGVACDNRGNEWVYIGFNETPNLLDTTLNYDGDIYMLHPRFRWDNEKPDYITLEQEVSSKFIGFEFDESAIKSINGHNKVLLELNWHGQGNVYFEYSLKGSSEAIRTMKEACNKFT